MNTYVVNKYSSLIPLNTRQLVGGSSILVYVSTTTEVGQIITVRDVDGFLSSPQSIVVSTVDSLISGGISSITLQQRFGYVSLRSASSNEWTIINENHFSEPNADYAIKGVDATYMTSLNDMKFLSNVSVGSRIYGNSLLLNTFAGGTLFTSSLTVNGTTTGMFYVNGAMNNSGNLVVQGNISTAGYNSVLSSVTAFVQLSTLGTISIQGGLTHSTSVGQFRVNNGISTAYAVTTNGAMNGAYLQVSNALRIRGTLTASTLTTTRLIPTTAVINFVNISTILQGRPDITLVAPNYVGITSPVAEIQQGVNALTTVAPQFATNQITTRALTISTFISSPNLSSIIFSNAQILNSRGRLITSSIQAQAIQLTTLFGAGQSTQIQTAAATTVLTSTINAELNILNQGNTQVQTAYASSVFSIGGYTSTLNLGNVELRSETLSLSTIFISSGMNAGALSSIVLSGNSLFNNSGGQFTGNNFTTSSATTFTTISQLYQITSGQPLYFSTAGNVATSTALVSSTTIATAVASSIRGVSMHFGVPLSYSTISPGGLFLIPSTVSGLTSNTPYEYVSGLGTTYNPIQCKASVDRTVYCYLGNISSFTSSYLNAQMTYRNDGSTSGTAGFRIRNSAAYSTLIQFSANPIQTIQTATLSNYPVDRNFNTVGTTYFMTGPNTNYPISEINSQVAVAVGGGAITYTYNAGVTWATVNTTLFSVEGRGIVWGNNKWVAVGQGATNTLGYSYNGLIWYGGAAAIFTTRGNCVVWTGQIWLAGGEGTNTLAYSYDGVKWVGLGNPIIDVAVEGLAWNGYQFVAVGSGTNTLAYSTDGMNWFAAFNTVFTSSGYSVAWNTGIWVAVGSGTNTLAYSSDGKTWTGIGTAIFSEGRAVAWNGVVWLAGGTGTYQIAYSSDGISWTPVSISGIMTTVYGVAWSLSQWVATGSSGGFAYSSNGISWTPVADTQFTGNGRALATRLDNSLATRSNFLLTTSDTYPILYSIGGVQWQPISSLISGKATHITWNGTQWLAGIEGGSDTLIYSYDGINWIGLGQTLFSTKCSYISWNGIQWVAVGSGTNTLAYSYDGTVWTGIGTGVLSTSGNGVVWGKDKYVATGEGTHSLAYSNDGIVWTGLGQVFFPIGRGIAYNGLMWVACGEGSATTLIYSSDGINWTAAYSQPFTLGAWDVAWNGVQWIALGTSTSGVNLAYSSDGNVWTALTLNISAKGIAWTGTKWLVTGASGSDPIVYSSVDGISWTSESPNLTGPAYTIASTTLSVPQEAFTIATGAAGKIVISSGGNYWWDGISSPFTGSVNCVAWNGFQWVAGGSGTCQIAYSVNGISWNGVSIANITAIYGVAYGSNKWVAVGEGAYTRAESTDGISWTAQTGSGFFNTGAYGILSFGGGFIAVGGTNSGGIARTTDGVNWAQMTASVFITGRAVATNGSALVATGTSASNTLAFLPYDGASWIGLGTSIFSTQGNGVAFGKSLWVAVGSGTNSLAYSPNGFDWTGLGTAIFSVRGTGIAWNGVNFVATGEGTNSLAYSPDGIHWTGQGTSLYATRANGVGVRRADSNTSSRIREPIMFTWDSVGTIVPLSPSSLQKGGATTAWDSRANSLESFTADAYLSWQLSALAGGSSVIGLSEAPTASVNYNQINYGIGFIGGSIQIYESGTFISAYGTYALTDTFSIIYNGTTITYYKNTTPLRSTARAVGNPLYLSCCVQTPGTSVINIEFHPLYKITTSVIPPSTSSYVASVIPGLNTSFAAPFYLTLPSALEASSWNMNITVGGNLTTFSTSLYADVYINNTKTFSTNVLSNIYLSSPTTYALSFLVPSLMPYTPGDTLSFRFKGGRSDGDAYIYTNWVNSNSTQFASTSILNLVANPNAVEYLEFFHTNGNSGLQTSELAVSITATSTAATSYLDSNYGIEMNKSYIKWNSRLNGVTIQNRFNDITTRSLTYTGALYNASDSNLKHNIEYIDSAPYSKMIENLPLRRFAFSQEYLSTFQLSDKHQLGVLTSEVAQEFPDAVHTAPFNFCDISTIHTVDRVQLRYYHLAATQHLMKRVSTLKGALKINM